MKTNAALFFIGVIVGFFFCWRSCREPPKSNTVTVYKTDSVTRYIAGKDIKEIVSIAKPHTDTFWRNVDTAVILADYYSVKTFSTSVVDSNISGTITDTITNNKLLGSNLTYKLIRPIEIIYNTTLQQASSRQFLFGFAGTYGKGNLSCIAPCLGYESKTGIYSSAGYDFINHTATGSIMFRIGK